MKYFVIRKILCLVLTVLLAAAALTGCAGTVPQATTVSTAAQTEITAIGEGQTCFRFTVTFADGTGQAYDVSTDADTVGEALQEAGLIEGEASEFGLYVKTVAGQTLDYDTDGKYWAFYVDDAYAVGGVDQTAITAGSVYGFRAE